MSEGEISGRLHRSGAGTVLRWKEGRITEVQASTAPDLGDTWLAPGLIDLQINGFSGIDFQRDDCTKEGLLEAVRGLRAAGCPRFFLTLITDEWEAMLARFGRYRSWCGEDEELRRAIAGWHVEGPFLSAEPGFRGAHEPSVMRDPTPADMDKLREVFGEDPVLLTLAPEREGALDAIRRAVELGIIVSVGHANPDAVRLREAVGAGARGFTHLGNACPQQIDRHDNILWRAFDTPGLVAGVIPDTIHVAPTLFRLIHKALPESQIYYTTDAVSPAGAPPGRYSVGRFEVEVGEDRVVRQPGQTNFAGSALTPIEGIRRAAEMLNRDWQSIWDFFSAAPARLMGLESGLRSGAPADFCVLKTNDRNEITELTVCAQGQLSGALTVLPFK